MKVLLIVKKPLVNCNGNGDSVNVVDVETNLSLK